MSTVTTHQDGPAIWAVCSCGWTSQTIGASHPVAEQVDAHRRWCAPRPKGAQ